MRTVFISMPLIRKSKEEIENIQNVILTSVKEYLDNDDLFVVDTYAIDKKYIDHKYSGIEYMCERLKLLATRADCIAFFEGWENVQRCHLEHAYAEIFSIPCLYVEGVKDDNV